MNLSWAWALLAFGVIGLIVIGVYSITRPSQPTPATTRNSNGSRASGGTIPPPTPNTEIPTEPAISAKRVIYFLTGHGENSPEESGEQSFSLAKQALEAKNYSVKMLNLLATQTIPPDAGVIVIVGPTKPLAQLEVDLLASYVDSGGSIIVMEEPLPVTDFGDEPDPLAGYLAETWGITLGQDIVIDISSGQPFLAIANQYGDHAITDKMGGIVTVFPTARSVTTDNTVTQSFLLDLVLTSTQSWAETDLEALNDSDQTSGPQIQPDEGIEQLGPITIAALMDDSASGARIVVFGDSEFASDSFFNQYGNGNLFVNAVDWATHTTAVSEPAGAQGATIEASATETEVTSEANLSISLEPFSYTLEDVGGGWNEGRVVLAFANKTNELIWFESPEIPNIVVETVEGPTYPAKLSRPDKGFELKSLLLDDKRIPLLPGLRFYSFGETTSGASTSISLSWRSATTTTPKKVTFPENPNLDFDLPQEKGQTISFPFISDPAPIKPFASLESVPVPGQLPQIQATFTGNCITRVTWLGNLRYEGEFVVKNTDAFNETHGEIELPYAMYYSDGYYQQDDRAGAGFDEEGAKAETSIEAITITVGPDQSARGRLFFGEHNLEYDLDAGEFDYDAFTSYLALFFPDQGYVFYDLSECELVVEK